MRTISRLTAGFSLLLALGATADVQVGPRPMFLVDRMDEGWLKSALSSCANTPMRQTPFSIGHRGAALQFPEHTRESYVAAARMGAGIIECDVTFTKDRQLVCRHSQCDLHTTTDILKRPELAEKCTKPFTPATFDEDGNLLTPASAQCCTSDITLDEFKTLCGKMDASNKKARTVEEYLDGTANFRTDLYASCGTVMSHRESIQLISSLGAKFTPELKSPSVSMPFQQNYTQAAYAQQMIDEYKALGVRPEQVYAQSFNIDDVLYWIRNEPGFGKQAVYLDGRDGSSGFSPLDAKTWKPGMTTLAKQGVNIIAPPLWMLVTLDASGNITPSPYALEARKAGLDIITWSLERSGLMQDGGGYYYQSIANAITKDADIYRLVDVLAWDVGVIGIFSDWPATVTYYANCMGLQ